MAGGLRLRRGAGRREPSRLPSCVRLPGSVSATEGTIVSDWTILCDFDGTIAVDDTTDTLLERFGRPGWERLEADWRAGRIDSHACMAGQVALLDMDRAQLDAHLAGQAIDPAFAAFVQAAHAGGAHVEVLSDGIDYAIRTILARHALDWLPVTSNRLEAGGERAWRLAFPNASPACRVGSGTCKCARADAARGRRKRVLMIGDGASDFCVAEAADFVFAKDKLIAHCVNRGLPYAAIDGFADAQRLLPELLDGRLAAESPFPTLQEACSNA